MSSTIERILAGLNASDDAVSTKTAAVVPGSSTEQKMLETLRRVSESTIKTAAVATGNASNSPANEVERMAKEAAEAEDAAMLRKAHHAGAALADGFMERYAQYDAALTSAGVKTASTVNPAAVKQAAEQGYKQAVADMEKQAAEEFNKGYEEQLKAIQKTAAEIHYAGQGMAQAVIKRAQAATAGR